MKTCVQCGGSMEGKIARAIYCSKACGTAATNAARDARVRGKRLGRACVSCGDSLDHRNSKAIYCSKNCRGKALYDRRRQDADRLGSFRAARRRYYWENPEVRTDTQARSAAYRKGNPEYKESHLRRMREKYHSDPVHRAKLLARQANWEKRNPEKGKARVARRRGLLRSSFFAFTEGDWEGVQRRYRWSCGYCGVRSTELHREHVIPLSRGGDHSVGNIIPACVSCNSSKGARTVMEWRLARV